MRLSRCLRSTKGAASTLEWGGLPLQTGMETTFTKVLSRAGCISTRWQATLFRCFSTTSSNIWNHHRRRDRKLSRLSLHNELRIHLGEARMKTFTTRWNGRSLSCVFKPSDVFHENFLLCGHLSIDEELVASVWFCEQPKTWRIRGLDDGPQREHSSVSDAIMEFLVAESGTNADEKHACIE